MLAGLTTFAQNLPEGTYLEKNGIAYRKAATLKPGTTDRYIIDIEAFVTGAVHKVVSSKPADIVLVLDVSGSMNDRMHKYTARTSQGYSYSGYGNNTYYYKHTDEQYYQVRRYDYNNWGDHYYALYYQVGNNTYFLSGTGATTDYPENYTQPGTTIWTGVLYTRQDIGTKMDSLKVAVGKFIDKIQENDLYETDESGKVVIDEATGNPKRRKGVSGADTTLGNRIAIVKYARNRYTNGNTTWNSNAPITVSGDGNNTYNGANVTEVSRAFTLTGTQANVDNLKAAVNSFNAAGATASDFGMNLAYRLINNIRQNDVARDTSDTKTVVFFTDGSPTYGNQFDDDVADHTISRAHEVKQWGVKVFTVGVFSDLGADASNVDKYMNFTSSNYPDAIGFNQGGTPVAAADRVFYQDASKADLSSIFTAIAESSGGSGNTDVSGTSPVTVDVIAASFALPTGASADDITVKVAKCVGKEGNYLQFDEPIDPGDADPAMTITPTVNTTTQKVSTTGFDFSANWCGYNEETKQYQGYKQIISFEIKVNDNAVGGPDVLTNDEKSGIYLADATEPLVKFNRPTVKIPISIWIKKQGLTGDDTAVFTIEYANYDPTVTNPSTLPKSAWKSFDKVAINSNSEIDSDGYPIVRLTGLDPDFFYRIREDQWAWSYDYQASGIQYTVGTGGSNPFVFVNKPKDTVKENESSVRNEFNERTERIATGGGN